MNKITMIKSVSMLTCLLSCFLYAIEAQQFQPGETEYGHPDLRGVWNFSAQTPLERPDNLADRQFLSALEVEQIQLQRQAALSQRLARDASPAPIQTPKPGSSTGSVNSFWMERTAMAVNNRTSLITHPSNGRLPPLQAGIAVQIGDQSGIIEIPGDRPVRYTHGGIARNGPEDRGLSERCLVFNSGPPLLSGPYNNNIQIFQNLDHVVLLAEMGFDARIVPLDRRPHIHADIELWSGDSRGYFEGNTLVVESRNFSRKIASLGLRDKAYGSAENRILIERFTPTSANTMDYEFTIDDPATFQDKLVVLMPMARVDNQLYEYACHPGNYALRNILRGARVEEGD